mgnify:CR=1 FL=1
MFMKIVKIKVQKKFLDSIFICVMLAIPVMHWLIFWFGVNFNSLLMAFQLPTGGWSLLNFQDIFRELVTPDSTVLIAIKNTFIYFAKDLLMLPFHYLIAYFLYKQIKGYRFFQIAFYLPVILSGVAISTMFSNFIAPTGPIGIILKNIGVDFVPDFLNNSDYATGTILFYTIWMGWGGHMLLFGGALARVPVDVLEAAKLDGVNVFQEIFIIVLPLVWSTMSTLLILIMTSVFAASGPILLFTKGEYETTTISYWIFDKVAYQGASAYNQVAAFGIMLTVIGVPVILFFKWLIEKIPTVEY